MLEHTFIHLPNIGSITERELWDSGIHTWADFLSGKRLPMRARDSTLRASVAECVERLDDMDSAYFARAVPKRETWRMYAEFRETTAFLDIETTGLFAETSDLTVVGILDRDGYHSYVDDWNMADFREAIESYDLIVTFNGAAFDLPFIEHRFGSLFANTPHLDLRYALQRIGFTGGLKKIERQLDVGRPSELTLLESYDAVRMWRMWKRGSRGARDTLIRYNAEDVVSLPKLADIVYNRLTRALRAPAAALDPRPFPDASDLPYDSDVIAALHGGSA